MNKPISETTVSATGRATEAFDLAISGGTPAVARYDEELFHWPIVTDEDERAVIDILRKGKMSKIDVTRKFEEDYARFQGVEHCLAHCNGTAALLSAMFGCGIGRGDEMIVPSVTYWASALQVFSLGATPVFADIDPVSLCIDPKDIEHRIGPNTKAIMVVHYHGHPADMDAINAIARRHGVKVIEDVSHAHGTRYKGRLAGALGDVAGISLMAEKSLGVGEGGILCTDDSEIYERAIAFAHYERTMTDLTLPKLKRLVAPEGFLTGLPLGGIKGRINQTCSAMGRVQLRHYPKRMQEIQAAMARFWDFLEDVPGLRKHSPKDTGSTMGGWYKPLAHYLPEELDDLPVERFVEAVNAELPQPIVRAGVNFPLHHHPVLNEADVYRDGMATRIAFAGRDLRESSDAFPVSESINARTVELPWFKHDRPEEIEAYALAFRKVAFQAEELLA